MHSNFIRISNNSYRNLVESNVCRVRRIAAGVLGPLLLCIAGLLAGTSSAMAGQHHTFIPGETRAGDFIFHNYCSVCHGDKGDGQTRARNGLVPPPRNYTTPEAAAELTRERMINSVTHGRPGTAMIAWGGELSDKEIEGVVDYIRGTFMQLGDKAERKMPDSDLLASRGGVLYLQNCAVCHGETGARDMKGRMLPPPRDFAAPAVIADLTRKRMITSITEGRSGSAMNGYGKQLSKADIEALVDYISKAYMSGSRSKQ